jgi:hypothetical protein
MRRWNLSRRTFLRGAGVALGLPLLDVMEPKSARAASVTRPPVRMGGIYMPNGVPFDAWKPKTSEGQLVRLNAWMKALEPHRSDLQFLTGLQSDSSQAHQAGSATWLVRPCPEGERLNQTRDIRGTSMDQIVASSIGDATLFPSLELITKPQGTNGKDLLLNNISWRDGNTPVPREINPRSIFDRLTGAGLSQSKVARGDQLSHRRSILDAVLDDARSLRKRISAADQHKIDEYLEAVRSIEKRMGDSAKQQLETAREMASAIAPPPTELPDDHGAYLRLMFDMMVLAFWTDSTRVSTFMLDHEESNRFVNFIPGVKGMWHSLSHWRAIEAGHEDNFDGTSWVSQAVKYEQYLKVIEFHHEQVAYFLDRLKAIPEGDGTLLDNCMILYGSPFADGDAHQSTMLPMLIAGQAGGKIRSGRVLDYPDEPAEGVYLSMMDIMGVAVDEIGGVSEPVAIT